MKAALRFGLITSVAGTLFAGLVLLDGPHNRATAGEQREPKSDTVILGSGIPNAGSLIMLPPIKVDYRDDETSRGLAPGFYPSQGSPVGPHQLGSVAGLPTGMACRNSLECNDCNVSTLDACGDSTCSAGALAGLSCAVDADCEGACTGGSNVGALCRSDLDCCGDGGATADGTCTFNPCVALTAGGLNGTGGQQCINFQMPDGRFFTGSECDDGVSCNGDETSIGTSMTCVAGQPLSTFENICNGGNRDGESCDPAVAPGDPTQGCPGAPNGVCELTPQTCQQQGKVCQEASRSCVAACLVDADCETDGFACTVDLCANPKTCETGAMTGTTCQTDADCGMGNICGGGGDGACSLGADPCGSPNLCSEGVVPGEVVCGNGRCCDPAAECNASTFAACQTAGNIFFGAEQACEILDSGNSNGCPIYGSGLAPKVDTLVRVGSISSFDPCGGSFSVVGDDYAVLAGAAPTGFVSVTVLRFVVSVETTARMAIEFRDAAGTFIEDTFVPNGFNRGVSGEAVVTVIFDPALTIPANGIFSVSIASSFGPLGRISLYSVAAAVADVGTNDANKLFVNGAVVTGAGGFLGQCSGGVRDGHWCDFSSATPDCGAGTCVDVSDVLAYEIVAVPAPAPTAACCIAATGTCSLQLPWDCTAGGNTPQPVGTACQACSADLFTTCTMDSQCPDACANSPQMSASCVIDADCAQFGGLCVSVNTCVPVPPACILSACCDPGTGTCTQVSGGTCSDVGAAACANDSDCTVAGATCEPNCPAGSTSQGFGSVCEPNCCTQPVQSGGDNCLLTDVIAITVPILGDPPVTVTVTGSNVGATFDDNQTAICVGGSSHTACAVDLDCAAIVGEFCSNQGCVLSCDPDIAVGECAGGGECTRINGSGIFNPLGTTADPGWWQTFSINACANVRLDTCCTDINGDPLRPSWVALYPTCPFQGAIFGRTGVAAPFGTGERGDGGARGAPFCLDDNFWWTKRALGAGTYSFPIYSAPAGTAASPPGATYQWHISVEACAIAACCTTVCEGGSSRDGQPCDSAGMPECPGLGAACISGVCAGGAFDGVPCDAVTGVVDQCPGGTCGTATSCAETTELVCGAAGGSFLAGPDYPEFICAGGTNAAMPCTPGQNECAGSSCVANSPIAVCAGSPCGTGSCCFGPGACEDKASPQGADCDPGIMGTCMDLALCTQQGGGFVGGSRCLFDPSPCPICTALSADDCQQPNGGFIFQADRNIGGGGGSKVLDDFIAGSAEIEQFCWNPAYANFDDVTGANINECVDPNGNFPPPPDNWEIRFFEDVDGLPGTMLHELAPMPISAKAPRDVTMFRSWNYSTVFNPPLGGFTVGVKYWVEFSGAGSNDCDVFLLNSQDGNGSFLGQANSYEQPGFSSAWRVGDFFNSFSDISFCIGGPSTPSITTPPAVSGACCSCDGVCVEDVSRQDCIGATCLATDCEVFCTGADKIFPCPMPAVFTDATFSPNQTCAAAGCENLGAGGGCPGAVGVLGEDCVVPITIPVEGGQFAINNNCSSTDGPVTFGPADDVQADDDTTGDFTGDQWYQYTAVDTGKVQVDVCADSNIDSVLAIYSNGTSVCPSDCSAAGLNPLLLAGGRYLHTACGAENGAPTFETFGDANICYLIRVGGHSGSTGELTLKVRTDATPCQQAQPVVLEQIENQFGTKVTSIKNRALSFDTATFPSGSSQAVRVTFVSLPAPYDQWNGTKMWVTGTTVVSENGGCTDPVGFCAAFPTFNAAGLECTLTGVLFRDWSTEGTVHVFHEGIVPGGSYEIAVLDASCESTVEAQFSAPMPLTNSIYGDTAGSLTSGIWLVADGSVGFGSDVTAAIQAFGGLPTAPQKARVDISNKANGAADVVNRVIDFTIDIGDITAVVDAFSGGLYPSSPSVAAGPCVAAN